MCEPKLKDRGTGRILGTAVFCLFFVFSSIQKSTNDARKAVGKALITTEVRSMNQFQSCVQTDWEEGNEAACVLMLCIGMFMRESGNRFPPPLLRASGVGL